MMRRGLEQKLGVRLSGSHPVSAWMVQHPADLHSKSQIEEDGRTAYERLPGKKCHLETVEVGEKVRCWLSNKE